jgi:site-specific recombinase XerD
MPTTDPERLVKALFKHDLIKTWLQNTISPNSQDARRVDLQEFILALKIQSIEDFKRIQRQDIIEWRDSLTVAAETPKYAVRSIKRKMSTISKFFGHLMNVHFIMVNPTLDVERPKLTANEGVTAIISDDQTKDILDAPDPKTLIGKRDRAILEVFAFHALRRNELCQLKLQDIQEREGIKTFYVLGKGSKERYLPINPSAIRRINEYLTALGNPKDGELPLFSSLSNNGKSSGRPLTPVSVYRIVMNYARKVGIDTGKFSTHSLRATAASNAIRRGVDIRKVQRWLGHASIQTTAMYDKNVDRPEDSPTYSVRY